MCNFQLLIIPVKLFAAFNELMESVEVSVERSNLMIGLEVWSRRSFYGRFQWSFFYIKIHLKMGLKFLKFWAFNALGPWVWSMVGVPRKTNKNPRSAQALYDPCWNAIIKFLELLFVTMKAFSTRLEIISDVVSERHAAEKFRYHIGNYF